MGSLRIKPTRFGGFACWTRKLNATTHPLKKEAHYPQGLWAERISPSIWVCIPTLLSPYTFLRAHSKF